MKKKLLVFFLIIGLMLSFAACSDDNDPDVAASNFLCAASEGDIITMMALTESADFSIENYFILGSISEEYYTDEQISAMTEAFFSRTTLAFSTEYSGEDTAIVTALCDIPDYVSVTEVLTADEDFLWSIVELDHNQEEYAQRTQMISEKIISLVNDGDYDEETTITFTLEKVEEEWIIVSIEGLTSDYTEYNN
jgi:hypothetical protein